MSTRKKLPLCSRSGDKEEDKVILQPFNYVLELPDKEIRTKLMHAFNIWLKVPNEKLNILTDIIHTILISSFLIDDIQDSSILNKEVPNAHLLYGVPCTINAFSYGVCIALEKVLSLNHPEATKIFVEQLLHLYQGQGIDIYWRDNYICPSMSEYKSMVIKKIGGLFILAIGLMQLYSECKQDFISFLKNLSLYYQIRNDYCSLCRQEYTENKTYCEDITEGKFSFPIIHAVQNDSEDGKIMKILRQRTRDVVVKRYCVGLIEKIGSLEYTKNVLLELDQKLRKEVESLGGNPLLESFLDELYTWNQDDNMEKDQVKCSTTDNCNFPGPIRESSVYID